MDGYSITRLVDVAKKDLSNARKTKNGEFYTQYNDIKNAISSYLDSNPNFFKGKTFC